MSDLNEAIRRIKGCLPLEGVISRDGVDLKRSGAKGDRKGECPFCLKKGLSVSVAKQIFKCFKCDLSGDVIKWVQARKGFDFKDALVFLAGQAQVELPSQQAKSKPKTARGIMGFSGIGAITANIRDWIQVFEQSLVYIV